MSNREAFIDMVGLSELGQELINNSDGGYNILVGSTAKHPIIFNNYGSHPHIYNKRFNSTAAGFGQIIFATWVGLCRKYGFSDFSKATQRAMILKLVEEHGALPDVDAGDFASAVKKCSNEWASLPGGDSGQHQQKLEYLTACFTRAGGVLKKDDTDDSATA